MGCYAKNGLGRRVDQTIVVEAVRLSPETARESSRVVTVYSTRPRFRSHTTPPRNI